MDMNQTVSRRFEPSSRTTLMGEQPNPWDLLQPQDVMSRDAYEQAKFGMQESLLHYPNKYDISEAYKSMRLI